MQHSRVFSIKKVQYRETDTCQSTFKTIDISSRFRARVVPFRYGSSFGSFSFILIVYRVLEAFSLNATLIFTLIIIIAGASFVGKQWAVIPQSNKIPKFTITCWFSAYGTLPQTVTGSLPLDSTDYRTVTSDTLFDRV